VQSVTYHCTLDTFSRLFSVLIDSAPPWRDLQNEAFICGCGHSGTTILANILAGHPAIHVPLDETGVFAQTPYAARRKLSLLRWEARRTGKRVLVEKTPKHIRHLDLLFSLSPRARLIIPVRDGRDVAASIARRYGEELDRGINRWIEDNSIVASIRSQPGVFCYRYEDFVADPATLLRQLCEFLELEWNDLLLTHHDQDRRWFQQRDVKATSVQDHKAFRNWQVNQPIFDGRNKWRGDYTEQDMRRLYEGKGGDLMSAWGYSQA
jgi:hypothetical protein